jgi:protease-4
MKILASLFTYVKSNKVPARVAAGLTMVAAIATQPLCATAVQPELPAKSALAQKPRVVEIRLSGALADRPHSFNFSLLSLAANRRPALTHLIDRCNALAKNPAIAGVFLNLQGFDLTLTQAQEVAELIHHLRRAGKKVAIYATNFDTNTYLMATAGNEIIMAPHGDMFLPGVQLQLMFFQGVLEKLHLQADMVQIGKYKGAEEPLTRTSASPAFAGEIHTVVNTWFDEIIATIARNRPMLTPADVHTDINRGWFDGHAALKAHLVDALADRLTVDRYLRMHFLGGCRISRRAGALAQPQTNVASPFSIFELFRPKSPTNVSNRPAVAVIFADGMIVDNSPAADENDSLVTPWRIHREIRAALANRMVKAIVLRIDSPGGSAAASEEIWQILHRAGAKKPLTVSMGAEAASGGYYIATAGRSITLDPGTIAGSIGVVGGKIVLAGLFKTIGLHVETFSRGKNVGLFDSTTAFSPAERIFVTRLMRKTYALFTHRVMQARGKHIANIQKVARGRLFVGRAAIHAGLADRIGSLEDVVLAAATKAHIQKNYQLMIYPRPKTFADILRERLGLQTSLPIGLSAALEAMPIKFRAAAMQMFEMMQTMQQDRVVLCGPIGLVQN